ncbi:DUF4190 domain-containing protein [Candidatus Woesearchaeota archaeon]|nr:DUF4190 domain-containing protein [Candidatus Woesearchaeota archaeon]
MKKEKSLAVTSFTLSLFFWIPLLNVFLGTLAIVFGVGALKNIKKSPSTYGGRAYAIAGTILGSLTIVLSLMGLILYSQ